MASLKELCHVPPMSNFLQNLKGVSIKSCWEIQVAFQMNKLFEKVESRTSLHSNLTILELFSLPKLESIWKLKPSHRSIARLQSPKVVSIEDCNKLKSIFSPSLAPSMLHVQKLYTESYNCLEQVIGFVQREITEFWVPVKGLNELIAFLNKLIRVLNAYL
ncbi:hypothetical protein Goshw_015921 [Gossypium schwendimanii]|uniref:Disease resistance protein At4g27190-like leucine-rich repeats domain-containing protein n=1 Tax=Gossypium schwendimanii TaxID=34291 RepID=A0A7J9M421_GOSSC|nr:hypothetical protein [Gossypium schwendimanii]